MITRLTALTLLLLTLVCRAGLDRHTLTIDGVVRQYLLYVPASMKSAPVPLVFTFHGHGGSAAQASAGFGMHTAWPEAVCVYMDGLPTPGRLTDPEGKRAGWQTGPGDQADRDLKFFDATLAAVQAACKIDASRIYSTGHSNGGSFTYLLWAMRPTVLAAVAPSGAAALRLRGKFTAKPVLHIAGRNDPLVKFAWQQATMAALLKTNRCAKESTAWEGAQLFASSHGTPMVQFIHDGGHAFPKAAPALIVKFFQHYSAKKS